MAEIAENQVQETDVNVEQADISTQLQAAMWDDKPITQQDSTETKVEEVKKEEPVIETPVVNEWWKEFEFQDADTAKNEIKRLKESKPEEIRFANEESKKFYEYAKNGELDKAHEMWAEQKRITKLLDGDVDERKAAEIIKFNLSTKKDFTEADVERKFNRQYGIPKEPVYDELKETEEEFKTKHEDWQQRVSDIKADMILDAKELKTNLEKLKAELVLPDIKGNNQETQGKLTPEELAAFTKQKEGFLQATNSFLANFNGFSTQVKDKDVDYNVSYGASQEEKNVAQQIAKEFAESGFDANALFVKEWLNQDGTLNVKQIIEDKMLLATRDKVFAKIANDAANQRLEMYLRDKKNIRIDNTGGKDFGAGDEAKSTSEKLQESFWGN